MGECEHLLCATVVNPDSTAYLRCLYCGERMTAIWDPIAQKAVPENAAS